MRHLILPLFIICFSFFSASAQTDEGRKSNSKLIQVKDGIYMLQGKGGNIGLSIGNDGVLMIDDQFAEATDDILKDIKKLSDKPVQFLVNTHHHPDHTGGNVNIVKQGGIIVSHENVRERLSQIVHANDDKSDASNPKMLATITFKEDMTFHYNNETILAFHVDNAHTDGDAIVYFTNSNVIHAGDVLFQGKYPFIDTKNGGTIQGYISALERLSMIADNDTKIIPGHGDIAKKTDLQFSASMLTQLYKWVTYHYVNRKTEAEIISMRDFTKPYDDLGYGDGFISTERILQTIYNEVKRERGEIDVRDMQERLSDKVKQQSEGAKKGG